MALDLEKRLKTAKKEVEDLIKKLNKIKDVILKELKPAKKASAKKKTVIKKKAAAKKTTPKKKVAVKKLVAKKTAKKTAGAATALETVYKAIPKSKKGVDVATLMGKTGFNRRKIYDNVKVLKKQGKIKSVGMGIYTKA